jgi:hypothetical protein
MMRPVLPEYEEEVMRAWCRAVLRAFPRGQDHREEHRP